MNTNELEQWAQSTCTSIEIATEIYKRSGHLGEMERIWNDPTAIEYHDIITAAHLKNSGPLDWGCELV